ncbi:antibiotic biosynthesis monooxygenase [Streptomyces sp. A73]|uniref:antibiotic biosynthesis monooxygenase family protein n=1 Tax=unclassified Streptomyces TaxID=2593676 RepID=UPI000C191399|nr:MULTISPECIES: antibiotic biosynthesis monooxygenase [unclassified Streptomyces]MBQ0863312.1 antibiotic biosynthesis monooxygenase [Streptomyces sp. RK75]MBQ1123379.1 antibiotic biosynthesis monooxygenase [Streptomyces sp. B15]MBQ1161212.1 antibiotic biosynthesis monooxygenase [Streptomyces sp. A73]
MSIVKINALTVPADQREVLEQRFAARKGFVESADGFEWFELLRPLEGSDRYLVYTRWRDEEAFQAWMNGPMKEAHQRAKGEDSGTEAKPAGSDAQPGGGERPKPAATDSETWSFEVVQQAPPKK